MYIIYLLLFLYRFFLFFFHILYIVARLQNTNSVGLPSSRATSAWLSTQVDSTPLATHFFFFLPRLPTSHASRAFSTHLGKPWLTIFNSLTIKISFSIKSMCYYLNCSSTSFGLSIWKSTRFASRSKQITNLLGLFKFWRLVPTMTIVFIIFHFFIYNNFLFIEVLSHC